MTKYVIHRTNFRTEDGSVIRGPILLLDASSSLDAMEKFRALQIYTSKVPGNLIYLAVPVIGNTTNVTITGSSSI